jgi:hypothetical protein
VAQVNGRGYTVTDWADRDREPMYGFYVRECAPTWSYFESILAGEKACPAVRAYVDISKPLFRSKNPQQTKQKRIHKALAVVLPALIMQPATVDELSDELGISCKTIREVCDLLMTRKYLIQAERSGLLFLTVTQHGNKTL